MIDFYSKLSREEALNHYKRYDKDPEEKIKKREKAWRKNLRVPKCKTTKAIDRYIGNLYSSLHPEIVIQLRNKQIDNVLIVSGMFGIIAPTDMIPDYELIMIDKFPNNRPVWKFWREVFTAADVKRSLQQLFSKFDHFYCLMSTTTRYTDAIFDLLATYDSYHIKSLERDRRNKLKSWAKVLNDALNKGFNSPREIEELSKIHNCKLEKLHISEARRFRELVEPKSASFYKKGTKIILNLLRELAKLRDEGIITSEEFEDKKKNLLDRI